MSVCKIWDESSTRICGEVMVGEVGDGGSIAHKPSLNWNVLNLTNLVSKSQSIM